MADPQRPAGAGGTDPERSVGELVLDLSERMSLLIREEVELAKTEVTEKVTSLARGSIAGLAAVVFLLLFFAMFMHAGAWLINDLFFEEHVWAGFLIEGLIWLSLAGAAGFIAYRKMSQGGAPLPEMAIEEAKLTRETLGGSE